MTIENVIKMAIEGGYKPKDCEYEKITSVDISRDETGVMFTEEFIDSDGEEDCKWMELTVAEVFLDPLFWQALGKVMGWKLKNDLFQTHDTVCVDYKSNYIDEWLYQWYQFVNTLAEGKTAEDYFKSLN